jgi:hypothetical protein
LQRTAPDDVVADDRSAADRDQVTRGSRRFGDGAIGQQGAIGVRPAAVRGMCSFRVRLTNSPLGQTRIAVL